MDDDDDFLYGTSASGTNAAVPASLQTSVPQPISLEQTKSTAANGVVANLEAQAEEPARTESPDEDAGAADGANEAEGEEMEEEEEEEEEDVEESDDDIEIITEPRVNSLDFRNKPAPQRTESLAAAPTTRPPPGPSLTTEYTPRERGTPITAPPPAQASPRTSVPPSEPNAPHASTTPTAAQQPVVEGPDPSTLPPVHAPPSHPTMDPSQPGMYEGRSILEVDLAAMADKGWRRPGSDVSDWFNYGFDEISWEAYCYRRRDMGEAAAMLKAGVINFAGMPEEQFVALPPEVRQMAMASANTVMNNSMAGPGMMQGPNGGMMQPNMPMMHDMGQMGMHMGQMGPGMNMPMGPGMGQMGPQGMGPQGMGPQGMGPSNMGQMGPMQGGMNGPGDMVQMGQGGPMMPDGQGVNMQGQGQGQGQGEGEGGFNQGPQGMMMGGEYPMQDPNGAPGMYPGMDQPPIQQPAQGGTPQPAGPRAQSVPQAPTPQGGFRGRGAPPTMPARGQRGGFARGGRGRGGPARVPSPLPPNVPTGPRNANKYKDRDTGAASGDALDYGGGGGGGGGGGRDSAGYEDDRGRKRRERSPTDEGRGSKRR